MSKYRSGEIFRLDGVTYQCVTDYVRVTEPKEGMLFRASDGVLYELKALGSTDRKCGCHLDTPDDLPCYAIDCQAFGTRVNRFHWYPVEEKKEEEKEVAEKKRHIELAVVEVDGEMVTFHVAEQTHRCDDFTPGGIPFKSSNGLTLKSVGSPAASTGCDTMYTRGATEDCDKRNITVSAMRFAKIMEAITEYNETNGAGYEKPWPKAGDEFYCVEADGSVGKDTFKAIYEHYRTMCKIGNCFKTEKEAKAMADKFKSMLKGE